MLDQGPAVSPEGLMGVGFEGWGDESGKGGRGLENQRS